MKVISIDPGSERSAFLIYETTERMILFAEIMDNEEILQRLAESGKLLPFKREDTLLAIEMIQSFGMPVGKEVFETIFWVGRFVQEWSRYGKYKLIYRRDIKLHFCNSVRAKDSNIRAVLKDKFAGRNLRKEGIVKDLWSSLAIAVFISETEEAKPDESGP